MNISNNKVSENLRMHRVASPCGGRQVKEDETETCGVELRMMTLLVTSMGVI